MGEKLIGLNPADVKLKIGEDERYKVEVKGQDGKITTYPAEISEQVPVETLVTDESGVQKVLLPEIF